MSIEDRRKLVSRIKKLIRKYQLEGYSDISYDDLSDDELNSLYDEVSKKAEVKKLASDFDESLKGLSDSNGLQR